MEISGGSVFFENKEIGMSWNGRSVLGASAVDFVVLETTMLFFDGKSCRTNSYNKVLELIHKQTNKLRGLDK